MKIDLELLSRSLPSQDALLALLSFSQEEDMVKAAQKLHLTQPALSFHLKKLEDQLGINLFTYSGKRKVLTTLGHDYVKEVAEILKNTHLITERLMKKASDLEHQKLRIAGRRELMVPFLPFPFPGQLEFFQSTSQEALRLLKNHEVDLAISARMEESSDFISKVFFESRLRIIYSKNQFKKPPNEAELASLPVVSYGSHQAYLKDYLKFRGIKSTHLKMSRVVEDWFSVVELVKLGFGWAVIPEAWALHSSEVGFLTLGEGVAFKQKIFFFYRREDRKSSWVELLEKWCHTLKE